MTLRPSPSPTLAPLLLAVLLGGECGRTHIHPTDHCPSPLSSPASARTLEKDTEVSGGKATTRKRGFRAQRRRLGLTSRSTLGGPLVLSASVSLTNLVSSH